VLDGDGADRRQQSGGAWNSRQLPARTCAGRRLEDLLPWPALHRALWPRPSDSAAGADRSNSTADGARPTGARWPCGCGALAGLGCVVGIDDQSRLKRLESLRRDFVANVSHELKTPLAAIQGFVETMQDDPDMPPATRQRFLERIARQSERLTTLVADLLTLSRLDEEGRSGARTPAMRFRRGAARHAPRPAAAGRAPFP
jgi:signal transduction histidine kinase